MIVAMNTHEEATRERYTIGLMLDFYGGLLPKRAREVLAHTYLEDLSLGEIAEQLSISRQAVHDRLRQGVGKLKQLEQRLGLVSRFQNQKYQLKEAIKDLDAGYYARVHERLREMEQQL